MKICNQRLQKNQVCCHIPDFFYPWNKSKIDFSTWRILNRYFTEINTICKNLINFFVLFYIKFTFTTFLRNFQSYFTEKSEADSGQRGRQGLSGDVCGGRKSYGRNHALVVGKRLGKQRSLADGGFWRTGQHRCSSDILGTDECEKLCPGIFPG